MSLRHRLFRTGLDVIATSGADHLAGPWSRGHGLIFTLHHVRPAAAGPFRPNALLEIEPAFLDLAVRLTREAGFDIVSLDEALARIGDLARTAQPFAVFTFDDGYRDNLDHAAPIMARHQAPWTMFVTARFADGGGRFWWLELEEAIRRSATIDLEELGLGEGLLQTATPSHKQAAFDAIYWRLRALAEPDMLARLRALLRRSQIDPDAVGQCLCLSWDELRDLSRDPLVSFGAHTLTHPMLAKHPADKARHELAQGRARIEAELGRPVAHVAYPVGDPTSAGVREFAMARDVGFKSGLTTRPGMIFPDHREHLHALPRVSLNGLFQSERALRALLSGLPFLAWNRGRRLNVG